MFQSYSFNIPIIQWESYLEHIIDGIYGIKQGGYNITREHNGVRRIDLKTNPHIPLINSLPRTIRNSATVYYSGNKLSIVGMFIKDAISDFLRPGGTYHINVDQIVVDTNELKPIIQQLACDNIITRYASLDNNMFIIYVEPYPLGVLVKIVDGALIANIYAETISAPFDVDDGYNGILSYMNPIWIKWKEAGDITAPIQPPNYL